MVVRISLPWLQQTSIQPPLQRRTYKAKSFEEKDFSVFSYTVCFHLIIKNMSRRVPVDSAVSAAILGDKLKFPTSQRVARNRFLKVIFDIKARGVRD